jgi:hypothetical protein
MLEFVTRPRSLNAAQCSEALGPLHPRHVYNVARKIASGSCSIRVHFQVPGEVNQRSGARMRPQRRSVITMAAVRSELQQMFRKCPR